MKHTAFKYVKNRCISIFSSSIFSLVEKCLQIRENLWTCGWICNTMSNCQSLSFLTFNSWTKRGFFFVGRAKHFPNFALQLYKLGHCTSKFSALQKSLFQTKKKKKGKKPNKQSWNSVCMLVYILKCFSFSTRNSEHLTFHKPMFKNRIKNL